MTTQEIIALAKERLGKDITEQEAQNYLDGKTAVPDEALDLVSGGSCSTWYIAECPRCGWPVRYEYYKGAHCPQCGYSWR